MSKDHFPAEELEVRVLYPPLAQRLVGQIVHVLEDEQAGCPSSNALRQMAV
jgi:hypothetical protein